jgi:pimeloyl-ACP methyl ester carboxylesterase
MTLAREVVDLGGAVHYLDSGGKGPAVVMVHGLGGAAINWLPTAEILRHRRRVLALDLPGFGLTPPADRSFDVSSQRTLLDRFIREVAGGRVLLMGNSMGGLISILQAAESPDTVEGLVLVNPAAPLNLLRVRDPRLLSLGLMAIPGVGERFARRLFRGASTEAYVTDFFAFVCHDAECLDPELVAAHVELAEKRRRLPWAVPAFRQATASTLNTLHSRRFVRAVEAVAAPTLLVHGRQDRLVSFAAAKKLASRRPDWRFEALDDIGHVPQIECPSHFVQTVEAWWHEARGRARHEGASRAGPAGAAPDTATS